jgi:hypothetical protein
MFAYPASPRVSLYDLVLADVAEEYAKATPRRRAQIVARFAHEWLLGRGEAQRIIVARSAR